MLSFQILCSSLPSHIFLNSVQLSIQLIAFDINDANDGVDDHEYFTELHK